MKKTFGKLLMTAVAVGIFATPAFATITEEQVLAAQQEWADGILKISNAFIANEDYKAVAKDHIKTLYAYEQGDVLFKPTLTSQDQFRETFEQALSYFVKGEVAEDKGFAIKPWKAVRFGEQKMIIDSDSAIAMGNYYFTPVDGDEEQKVEFTFGYMEDENDQLRINVHHSSLPFSPAE